MHNETRDIKCNQTWKGSYQIQTPKDNLKCLERETDGTAMKPKIALKGIGILKDFSGKRRGSGFRTSL